jgi:ATP-dependent Lhr-like helicase
VLARLEFYLGRSVSRVGLSATVGDSYAAAEWLYPEDPLAVSVVSVGGEGERVLSRVVTAVSEEALVKAVSEEVGEGHSLIFANHPAKVESFSQSLNAATGPRVRVLGHHGRLGKVEREDAEEKIREDKGAVAVVATSTLELGIDVGELDRVIQVVPEATVAAVAQRGGRSGRRGERGQLTYYVVESPEVALEELALGTTTALAQIEAWRGGWVETPGSVGSRSTLIHQVMAILSERHGASASSLWKQIKSAGVFDDVSAHEFAEILRAMGVATLIEEGARGLVLGELGEREASHYSFYAVFGGSREWRVVSGADTIGIVNGSYELGKRFVLSGRGWEVRAVDPGAGVLEVVSAPSGATAIFGGGVLGEVDYVVRRGQWDLYISKTSPEIASRSALEALERGRTKFFEYGFFENSIGMVEDACVALCFCGDRGINGALRALSSEVQGYNISGAMVFYESTPDEVAAAAGRVLEAGADFLGKVAGTKAERYDWVLPADLLAGVNFKRLVDEEASTEVLRRLARPRRRR